MKNNRYLESIAPSLHFEKEDKTQYHHQIFLAPSDIGVRLNKGKNGARFAPEALVNQLKKLNKHFQDKNILASTVSNQSIEKESFQDGQTHEKNSIHSLLNKDINKYTHIGGGHDHISPLLFAIDESDHFDNIVILNIDAHCDTRVDSISHSGTPFRDFDNKGKKDFHLIQFGIHDYANSTSTLTDLKRGSESKLFYPKARELTQNFTNLNEDIFKDIPFKTNEKTAWVLSLDCDGIDGSQMQAVSAVNTQGVPLNFLSNLIQNKDFQFFGVYELNPVFDTTNNYCTKSVAHLIYQFIN